MERNVLVPIGLLGLAVSAAAVGVFGPRAALASTSGALLLAGLVLASACAVAAGYGVGVGPVSWRTFAGLSYVLFGTIIGFSATGVDLAGHSYMPPLVFYAVVVLSVVTMVAIGVDVALDRRSIVELSEPTSEAA